LTQFQSPQRWLAARKNPEAAIFISQLWPNLVSLENNQLLPKADVFGDYVLLGT